MIININKLRKINDKYYCYQISLGKYKDFKFIIPKKFLKKINVFERDLLFDNEMVIKIKKDNIIKFIKFKDLKE